MKKRIAVALVAVALIVCCSVAGTLAWLKAETSEVVNTFTYGDINIELDETDADNDGKSKENEYKMVPGNTIAKDPVVTVLAESEDCHLFVKITEVNGSNDFDSFIKYCIATEDPVWQIYDETAKQLTNITEGTTVDKDVYYIYRSVSYSEDDQSFYILGCMGACDAATDSLDETACTGCVKVDTTVTKEMMQTINDSTEIKPQLKFEAAAIQSANMTIDSAFTEAESLWTNTSNAG